MSDTEHGVLTRQELEAILESVASAREAERKPFVRERETFDSAPLARALREFGEEQGRAISTVHQRPMTFSMTSFDPVQVGEFADSLIEHDRVVLLGIEPGARLGCLLLGRSLLFGWMTLAFGGRTGIAPWQIPARAYTRIEERFLLRAARELTAQLQSALPARAGIELETRELVEPAWVPRHSQRSRLATFDVRGLDDLCRLRVLLPEDLLDDGAGATREPEGPQAAPMRSRMLGTPVNLHVEVGSVELSLRRLATLREGDLLPLRPADAGGLVVRVEEEARFRAERGVVGNRLAVQLLERL